MNWNSQPDITQVRQRAFATQIPCLPPNPLIEDEWIFLGLVVIAQVKHPVPSRTRKLSTAAAMVLRLKAWESSSPPNLVKSKHLSKRSKDQSVYGAGWSSPVARQAHNLKVAGSNPAPATNIKTITRKHTRLPEQCRGDTQSATMAFP